MSRSPSLPLTAGPANTTSRLVLVPQGGLCNRLRAILSALSLIEGGSISARLVVGWDANAECAARFDQLFEPIDSPHVSIGPRRWTDRPITRRNLHWPALVRSLLYRRQYANRPPAIETLSALLPPQGATEDTRAAVPAASAAVYVSTGHAFCDYPVDYVRRLRPQTHLQERIDSLSAGFDSHTIGIHIRRTDHVTAIAESPDTLFAEAIASAIDDDPDARFFLATDDASLKRRLADQFPGRITTQNCRGSRADLAGMEEAVVDLWTLARCSRIIGSFWSSYTDTAAEIGGIPLTIIRK